MEELLAADKYQWIAPAIADAAKTHNIDLKTAKQEEIVKITPPPPLDQLVAATVKQVAKMGENWTAEMAATLKRHLLSDLTVKKCLKLAERENSQLT